MDSTVSLALEKILLGICHHIIIELYLGAIRIAESPETQYDDAELTGKFGSVWLRIGKSQRPLGHCN
jgi:hypothetical protein